MERSILWNAVHRLTFFILSLTSISYCRFKYINVYIF